MADCISRDALLMAFEDADADVCENYPDGYSKWGFSYKTVRKVVKNTPSADVAPVVHGRWMELEDGFGGTCYMCSRCAEEWALNDGAPTENNMYYCPQCGAKMDEEELNR